jgi:hypothetical protein
MVPLTGEATRKVRLKRQHQIGELTRRRALTLAGGLGVARLFAARGASPARERLFRDTMRIVPVKIASSSDGYN